MAEADPPTMFNVHDAKTNLSKLMERAHAGEEIILAKSGVPYAKLGPLTVTPKSPREPGGWPELAGVDDSVWFDPLPEEELARWEGQRLEKYGP